MYKHEVGLSRILSKPSCLNNFKKESITNENNDVGSLISWNNISAMYV